MAKKKVVEIDSLAARLRQAIEDSGQSLSQLGRLAAVDHSRLSRFLRGERDLTLEAVDKLCAVLGLTVSAAQPAALREDQPPADAPVPFSGRRPKQAVEEPAAPTKKGRRKKESD